MPSSSHKHDVGYIKPQLKKLEPCVLTPKMKTFADHWLVHHNQEEAARTAKYKRPDRAARRLMHTACVQDYIAQQHEILKAKLEIHEDRIAAGLLKEAKGEGKDTNSKSRVAAWIALGNYLGMFHNRDEAKVEINILGVEIDRVFKQNVNKVIELPINE